MDKAITEKRQFPRISATFPIRITPEFLGQAIDLSETGLRFVLEKPLLLSKVPARIELSSDETVETEFKVIWSKHLVKENKFTYGVCFIRLKEKDLGILRKILSKCAQLNEEFVDITQNFRDYLISIKTKFDDFDMKNISKNQRIQFLETQKNEIFKKIDGYLKNLWSHMENLDKRNWNLYTHYLRTTVNYLFIHACEINEHIFKKPLGYSGDFITMNYILDYHQNAYLGNSSYEMLLNHYACNVPIANSNVKRNEFFKNKIIEIVRRKENAKILSVGGGPVRELFESLDEGSLRKKFIFHSLDFEKKAINYLKGEIRKIDLKKRDYCHIKYINKDYIDLAKNKSLDGLSKNYDFIYCSGVFDYLKNRIATRLIGILFSLLNKNGILILCNANNKDSYYRIAYEVMGNWIFYHREKEELIQWLKHIKDIEEMEFEKLSDTSNYLFLSIKPKTLTL